MIGIVLAAGKGTRLRPLTYAIPKPLLPVGGKPVLDYAIENLCDCDEVEKIYVAVSDSREIIKNYLAHMEYGTTVETVSTNRLETGGDLRTIIDEKGISDPVLVAYGDVVSKIDTNAMFRLHKKLGKPATLCLFAVPKEDISRFGIAKVENGLIRSFIEKPKLEEAPSNLANAGYYILEKAAYSRLPKERKKVEETLFPNLAKNGELAAYVSTPPYWLDIGTIESYRKANRMIEGVLAPNGKVGNNED